MGDNETRVVTGPRTRWAFVNVWRPKPRLEDGRMMYSVRLLIPKDDTCTVEKIKRAMRAAYDADPEKLTDEYGAPEFEDLRLPLQDGDQTMPGRPEYAGHWYMNCNTQYRPGVLDAEKRPILETRQVYSGVYGRASVSFYAYNGGGGQKGVACALRHLQKIRDGEPLGNAGSAEEDFRDEE